MTAFDPKRTFRPAILAFIFANGVVVIPGFLRAKAPVAAAPSRDTRLALIYRLSWDRTLLPAWCSRSNRGRATGQAAGRDGLQPSAFRAPSLQGRLWGRPFSCSTKM